jgi:hypothetical protein
LNLQRERERERENDNAKANLELLLPSGSRHHGGGQGGTGMDPTMMKATWHRSGHGAGAGTHQRRRCGQRVADEEWRRRLRLMEEASLYIGTAATTRRTARFPGAVIA